MRILRGEMPPNDPLMHFVLINTAALFVVSGVCDADTRALGDGEDGKVITERGPSGGRWKEGIRRAKWAIILALHFANGSGLWQLRTK
jgi:anthranilate phosphoribosyltransferase